MTLRKLALLALLGAATHTANAADLDVSINGIKEFKGSLFIALYNSAESFTKTPYKSLSIPADAETVAFTIDELETGEFAIMLFHDIDANGKLDTNLVGMPREPWGGSLQGKAIFAAPGWKDTKFTHSDEGTQLTIELN